MANRLTAAICAHLWGVLFVGLYLALGIAFSVVNPIHEATDELRHYRYVRYIADYGKLPVQSGEQGNAQAHHPPLYYATAALLSFWAHPADPLYEPLHNPQWGFRNWEIGTDNKNQYLHGPDEAWPYRDTSLAVHLGRWVTLLWGAGTVLLTAMIAHTLIPDRPAVGLTATALVALNPMFLYLGAAINNDVPAGLVGAAVVYACLRVLRDGLTTRRLLVLGVLYGVALLVKFNLLAMLAVIEAALILAIFRGDEERRWRNLGHANAIVLGLALLIAGWWYVRNTILYGEPTGFLRLTEIWGVRDPRAGVSFAGRELGYAWTSLWGRFGYGQIPLPNAMYLAVAVLCGLGLAGLLALIVRASLQKGELHGPLSGKQRQMVSILGISVLVNFAVLYAYIAVSPAGAMGRFFFPGLSSLAVLVGLGLVGLLSRQAGTVVGGLVTAGMFAFVLVALWGYLAPAYAVPAPRQAPAEPLDISVGGAVRILDYHMSPGTLRPGGELDVTVTWQVIKPTAVPYLVFIHLINPDGVLIAQRDTYTGLGNYPSNWWRPGHIFTETYRLFLPETAYAPDEATVYVGLYNSEAGRLPIAYTGTPDAALPIGEVAIEADPDAAYPNQIFINWENHFALVGYEIRNRVRPAGKHVIVTLYWQALDPPQDEDFKVFLHVVRGWEGNFAGLDGAPVYPDARTSEWTPGEVYVDERKVRLPKTIPPGLYELELGWFSAVDGSRLDITAEDGHIVDDWLLLSPILVTPADE